MSENSNGSPWKNPAIWGRVVFVVLFLLLLALIVGPLAIALSLVQAVFTIFGGEDNRNLRTLAAALAEYVHEILLFATWNSEKKPFPFTEFPSVASDEETLGGESAATGETAQATETDAATNEKGTVEDSEGESDAESKPSAGAATEANDDKNAEQNVCPECGHVFQGNGWQGLDVHWKTYHESIMPYSEAWPLIRDGKYRRRDEPE